MHQVLSSSPKTAVFYPIVLAERVELLLSFHDGSIQQFQTNINSEDLEQEAKVFIEKVRGISYECKSLSSHTDNLYKKLIKPITNALQQKEIDTLIIIPHGILTTIPFAALCDGEKYLIQTYALAITPGLELTVPQKFTSIQIQALLNGLSKRVEGFKKLQKVSEELGSISCVLKGDTDKLVDKDFRIAKVGEKLAGKYYSIVHFSTHGYFDESSNNSYLLTYDSVPNNDKQLTMDCLEELIYITILGNKPVELLTFSACETALGKERATLGLAGIAVKAGAHSALATLWIVNEFATKKLLTEFYRQINNNPHLSKAKALQCVQRLLIEEDEGWGEYKYPHHWAAFLLIGNWL